MALRNGLVSLASFGMIVLGLWMPISGSGNPCSGYGIAGEAISCLGTCHGSVLCSSQDGAGPGFGVWFYCGCPDVGQWACCHLVRHRSLGTYAVFGDCQSCPASGTCQLAGSGTPLSPYVAACD